MRVLTSRRYNIVIPGNPILFGACRKVDLCKSMKYEPLHITLRSKVSLLTVYHPFVEKQRRFNIHLVRILIFYLCIDNFCKNRCCIWWGRLFCFHILSLYENKRVNGCLLSFELTGNCRNMQVNYNNINNHNNFSQVPSNKSLVRQTRQIIICKYIFRSLVVFYV